MSSLQRTALSKLICLSFFLLVLNSLVLFAEDKPAASDSTKSAESAAAPKEEAPKKPAQNLTILSVRIQGNEIVNTTTILTKIAVKEGGTLNQEVVNEDIKRLYATGFFKDIRFDVDPQPTGVNVILVVDEKPVVKQIVIQGNHAFKEKNLRKEINILEGQVLDERLIVEGTAKIQKKYLDKGYHLAKVEYRVEASENGKESTIYIQINEGVAYKIKSIQFEGVKSFKKSKIKKLIQTKVKNPWLLNLKRNSFKEEMFKDDLERVSSFYQDEGFLDVKVEPDFQYGEQLKQVALTIRIDEGAHYLAGSVSFEGNKIFPEHEIWQQLFMLPGTTYSQKNLTLNVEAIRKFYFARGYMEAHITPDVKFNKDTGKVDVFYKIEEGDLFFIDKVKIRGNNKTKDIVIRRELRIKPGEKFNGDLVEKSKQRLNNLGYFEEVTYDTETGSAPNRKDIVFHVKEKQTGELSFGAGYSSVDQFIGFAEISQRNFDLFNWPRFTGGGQSISLQGRIGSISKNVEFGFVEPYIFGKHISFALNIYNTRYENRNVDFTHDRLGAGITFAKSLNDLVKVGTGYTVERVKVFDIPESAAQIVKDAAGVSWLSRLKLFTSRDSTDSPYNPTKGSVVGLSGELIGTFLGGDESYYITQAYGNKYWSFGPTMLEWRNRLATSSGIGSTKDVPVYDRFFAGGLGTIRGYNYRRVSPKESDRPIGGETLFITNLEYTFGLPFLDIMKGAVFIDAGEVSRDTFHFFGSNDFVVSTGPGVKVNTPIGPLAFYYGYPVMNPDTKNKHGRFEFSLSRSF